MNLPPELILAVTDYIDSISCIANLVRTCRYLYNTLNLRLYLVDLKEQTEWYNWGCNIRIGMVKDEPNAVVKLKTSINERLDLYADYHFYTLMDFISDDHVLHCASRLEHLPIIFFLLQNGATRHSCPISWTAAWHRSLIGGHEETVKLFIDQGVDAKEHMWERIGKSYDRSAPLHLASGCRHPKLVSLLIENGASVTDQIAKATPLHWAVMPTIWHCYNLRPPEGGDLVGTVRVLLQYGADPKWRAWLYPSVIDYVRAYPDISFLRLMKIHTLRGADADYLETIVRDQLQAPGSWSWADREAAWRAYIEANWMKLNEKGRIKGPLYG